MGIHKDANVRMTYEGPNKHTEGKNWITVIFYSTAFSIYLVLNKCLLN